MDEFQLYVACLTWQCHTSFLFNCSYSVFSCMLLFQVYVACLNWQCHTSLLFNCSYSVFWDLKLQIWSIRTCDSGTNWVARGIRQASVLSPGEFIKMPFVVFALKNTLCWYFHEKRFKTKLTPIDFENTFCPPHHIFKNCCHWLAINSFRLINPILS
jgi:hypothetical protein